MSVSDARGSNERPEADAAAFLESLGAMSRGFMESRAFLTAIELDLFTGVGHGGSAGEVAARLGTDARGTAALLHHLVAAGLHAPRGSKRFLELISPDRYQL